MRLEVGGKCIEGCLHLRLVAQVRDLCPEAREEGPTEAVGRKEPVDIGSADAAIGRGRAIHVPRDLDEGSPAIGAAGAADGLSFGQVLANIASDAVGTLKTAEATSISGIQGKASVQQVVEAVMSAEQTLQTALAVRDKVVAAYQELSRMAI